MKQVIRKILALAPNASISFSARAAIIATTLSAAGRAFAGGTTSGINPAVSSFSSQQLQALKAIVEEKMEYADLDEERKIELETIAKSIKFQIQNKEIEKNMKLNFQNRDIQTIE